MAGFILGVMLLFILYPFVIEPVRAADEKWHENFWICNGLKNGTCDNTKHTYINYLGEGDSNETVIPKRE